MKKYVILSIIVSSFIIVFAVFWVVRGKSREKELEELRFTFLTSNSSLIVLMYKHLENEKLSNKHGSIILTSIHMKLMILKVMLLSKVTNDDSKRSSILSEIKGNNNILIKQITSSPALKGKSGALLKTLTILLHLPISAENKALVQKFMKDNYSIAKISTEDEKTIFRYNFMKEYYSLTHEEFLFMTISYLEEYTSLLRIFSLYHNGKTFEIKSILRNKIIYNDILISLIIKRNAGYDKASYVKYKKNLVIQNIINGTLNP